MVSGLNQGERVQAKAENVLGRSAAKVRFPETWEDAVLHSVVLQRQAGAHGSLNGMGMRRLPSSRQACSTVLENL